jgi:hypothetical protein
VLRVLPLFSTSLYLTFTATLLFCICGRTTVCFFQRCSAAFLLLNLFALPRFLSALAAAALLLSLALAALLPSFAHRSFAASIGVFNRLLCNWCISPPSCNTYYAALLLLCNVLLCNLPSLLQICSSALCTAQSLLCAAFGNSRQYLLAKHGLLSQFCCPSICLAATHPALWCCYTARLPYSASHSTFPYCLPSAWCCRLMLLHAFVLLQPHCSCTFLWLHHGLAYNGAASQRILLLMFSCRLVTLQPQSFSRSGSA